ncbi:MAG: hypothetical protein CVV18_02425 [Gammaproteobacteria bacterium HGW-Gammaproteobacteria-8]|nr:MAG: hypothetical protein CVV18_02425 [Gammaproteobacteria bacterium HGW-Gammaproteobacteria-8]
MNSAIHADRRLRRIARVSAIARVLLTLGALLAITSWTAPMLVEARVLEFNIGPLRITWDIWSKWPSLHTALAEIGWSPFAFLVMPRVLVFVAVVFQVVQMFGLYQQGLIFTFRHVLHLHRIGVLLILWGAILLGLPALIQVLAEWFAEGYQGYWFSADWDAVFYIVAGLGIMVMAWVMQEGLKLQHEQELTV